MIGILPDFMKLNMRHDLEGFLWRHVMAYIPHTSKCGATGCGYDSFTASAINPACLECNGRGLVYNWHQVSLHVRPNWIDPAHNNVFAGVITADIGDAQFQAKIRDKALWEKIRDTEHAYVLMDGKKLHPESIADNSVEGLTTIDIRCHIISEAKP